MVIRTSQDGTQIEHRRACDSAVEPNGLKADFVQAEVFPALRILLPSFHVCCWLLFPLIASPPQVWVRPELFPSNSRCSQGNLFKNGTGNQFLGNGDHDVQHSLLLCVRFHIKSPRTAENTDFILRDSDFAFRLAAISSLRYLCFFLRRNQQQVAEHFLFLLLGQTVGALGSPFGLACSALLSGKLFAPFFPLSHTEKRNGSPKMSEPCQLPSVVSLQSSGVSVRKFSPE